MPLLLIVVDIVIGFIGFRQAAEHLPSRALAWIGQTALDPDTLTNVGLAGAVFGLLYTLGVLLPWRWLSMLGAPYQRFAIPMAMTAVLNFAMRGTGAALLAICPVLLAWSKFSASDRELVNKHALLRFLVSMAEPVVKAGIVGAPLYLIAPMIDTPEALHLMRRGVLIVLGMIGVLFVGVVMRVENHPNERTLGDADWIIDGVAIGGFVGFAASVYPYRGFSIGHAGAGILAGFFIGLFVGGFERLIEVAFAGVFPKDGQVQQGLRSLIRWFLPAENGRIERALARAGGAAHAAGSDLAKSAVASAATLGLALGVFLFVTEKEVFSFFSYYHAAKLPEGCPKSCASQAFLVPFAIWGQNLGGADLTGATLSGSMSHNVDFRGSTLARANLSRTILPGSMFDGADLTDGQLSASILSGASFIDADLTNVDLSRSDLRDADLRARKTTGLRVGQAWYNARTQWPDGFDPVRAGAMLSLNPAGTRPDGRTGRSN